MTASTITRLMEIKAPAVALPPDPDELIGRGGLRRFSMLLRRPLPNQRKPARISTSVQKKHSLITRALSCRAPFIFPRTLGATGGNGRSCSVTVLGQLVAFIRWC